MRFDYEPNYEEIDFNDFYKVVLVDFLLFVWMWLMVTRNKEFQLLPIFSRYGPETFHTTQNAKNNTRPLAHYYHNLAWVNYRYWA